MVTSQANGEPGAVAICSSQAAAQAGAAAAQACGPTSLALHLGVDTEIGVVRATGDADALVAALAPSADVALHRTASRRLLRHRRTWDLRQPTPGVTQLYLTRARAGLSADDYHRYWEREHGPRALRHHLGMWDYTQVSVTETVRGEAVHGVAVTEWPRPEELAQRFTDGPVGSSVIQQDAGNFTDLAVLERHLMDERILVDLPWPTTGAVEITDARHLEFDRPADVAWLVVGRFDAIREWWPGDDFTACSTVSDHGIGMTRTMTRADGSHVVERLLHYRPDEKMLQLSVDEGMPDVIASYTCRYEVRPIDDRRSRLDWYPRASVPPDAVDVFGAVVDRGWPMVAEGLSAAVAAA